MGDDDLKGRILARRARLLAAALAVGGVAAGADACTFAACLSPQTDGGDYLQDGAPPQSDASDGGAADGAVGGDAGDAGGVDGGAEAGDAGNG